MGIATGDDEKIGSTKDTRIKEPETEKDAQRKGNTWCNENRHP